MIRCRTLDRTPPKPKKHPTEPLKPTSYRLFYFLFSGRVLTEKEFRAEATLKYDGLSVEEATRGGKLEAYSAPPNVALAVLGRGLFAFLQGRIAETCRNVYPVVSVSVCVKVPVSPCV